MIGTALGVTATFGYFYVTDTRASIHRWLAVPVFMWLHPDPEDAHVAGNKALKGLYMFGWHPRERSSSDSDGLLEIEVSPSQALQQSKRLTLRRSSVIH